MNNVHQGRLNLNILLIVAVSFSATPVLAGFLDKLKDIESAVDMATKPPKVQADVGGVKLDLSSCSAKTGVKTIDNATKEKTDGKCDKQEKKDAPAKVVKVKEPETDMYADTDGSADR